jgi:hypothetical protein
MLGKATAIVELCPNRMNELANGDLYTTLLQVLITISTLLTLDLIFFRDE